MYRLFASRHCLFQFQNVSFPECIAATFVSFFRLLKRADSHSSSLQLPVSKGIRPAQKGPGEVTLAVFCLKEILVSQKLFLTCCLASPYNLLMMEMVTACETVQYWYIPGVGHPL